MYKLSFYDFLNDKGLIIQILILFVYSYYRMRLNISGLIVDVFGLQKEYFPINTLSFKDDNLACEADLVFSFHLVDNLPDDHSDWMLKFEKQNLQVYECNSFEIRLIANTNHNDIYAMYEEKDKTHMNVFFLKTYCGVLKIDTIFISCLALERHFANRGSYILHCAHLCYKGMSILFSGPSGIGKSTHADIWCKNVDDTHVVNGDRCLITRDADGKFEANGWPICGSSEYCLVEHHPLKAIVFIERSVYNHVICEDVMSRYKRVLSQLTVNHWNKEITSNSLNFIMDIVSTVPIVTYSCNMKPDAALLLKEYIDQLK